MTCFYLIESFRVDGTLVHKSWLFSIPIYSPRWLRESLSQKQLGQPSSEQNTTRSKLSLGPPKHLSPATWSWPTKIVAFTIHYWHLVDCSIQFEITLFPLDVTMNFMLNSWYAQVPLPIMQILCTSSIQSPLPHTLPSLSQTTTTPQG